MFITPEEFPLEYNDTPYPFTDGSEFSTRDKQQIPYTLFRDANVYTYHDELLCLTEITVNRYTLEFSFSTATAKETITGTLNLKQSLTDIILYEAGRCCGILLCSQEGINTIASWPINTYIIPFGRMQLLPKCCKSLIANGITGITVDDQTYQDNVGLIFGNGMIAEPNYENTTSALAAQTVRIHAIGEPLIASGDSPVIEGAAYTAPLRTLIVTGGHLEKPLRLTGAYVTFNSITTEDGDNILNIQGSNNALAFSTSGAANGT